MKNKYFSYIFALFVLICIVSTVAFADEGFFANDASGALPGNLEGVYAIGGGGTELLYRGEIYALTGSGLQQLGTTETQGGGGLVFDDGQVEIQSDRVKVGLAYSFSSSRDTSVPSAVLENVNGSGFSVGIYDEYERFIELAATDASSVLVLPGPDSAVEVYLANDERLAALESTAKDAYLVIRAISESEQALTRYAGIEYRGEFCFAVLANDRLTVVNHVDLENYVMGVCAIEMSESWPLEALKAQAIAARTFVQSLIKTSVYYYTCGFDVTADTYTQAYRGTKNVGDNIRTAVSETSNLYLTQNGALIDALYSAADGGATEDAANVFGYPNTCLIGVFDPYEAAAAMENPYASWTVTMTPSQLGALVGIGPVQSVTPTTSRTGNVIKLEFVSTTGQRATLIRDNCRTRLNLKNLRYDISRDSYGNFVFKGSGFGHNLGMSQWGAYAMAKYFEKDHRFILGFYYSKAGLSVGELPPKPEPPPEYDMPEEELAQNDPDFDRADTEQEGTAVPPSDPEPTVNEETNE